MVTSRKPKQTIKANKSIYWVGVVMKVSIEMNCLVEMDDDKFIGLSDEEIQEVLNYASYNFAKMMDSTLGAKELSVSLAKY